jgi:hypothetical protein
MAELKDSQSSNVAIEDKSLSKEDMIDLLGDESEEESDKEEPEKEEVSEEKEEDEIEIDEKEEPESDKDEEKEFEFETPVSRKQILAKYPKIFKEFPQLQKSMYRDKEFTELLGDPKDAEEVIGKAKNLDEFEKDLLGGNTEKLLNTIKQANEKSFHKIVDNYLQTLAKVDEKSFYHVVGTVIDNVISGMVQEARRLGKESGSPLESAATILNQFMNGTVDFKPRGRLAPEESKDSETEKLQAEREQFIQEKFESKRDDLDSRVTSLIKSTIERNIDPKEEMSDYVRRAAIRDAMETTQQLIDGDESYQKIKDRLWEQAFENNFSQSTIDRIKSAHLSKAKVILRDVIKKARNTALKGPGHREESSTKNRKGTLPVGRATTERSAKTTDPKAIPKGMKSLDFLMQD